MTDLSDRLRVVARDVEDYIEADHDLTLGVACEPHDIGALIDLCRLIANDLDRSMASHLEGMPAVRYDVCARATKGMRT
jgi:hypothetical protein